MMQIDSFVLGIIFLAVGVGVAALIVVFLRNAPAKHSQPQPQAQTLDSLDLDPHAEGVLIVQAGGRVTYINDQARALFELGDKEPNLEHLAKRVRPSEAFFSLCAVEGQTSFSLDNRLVEGISYRIPLNSDTAILVSLKKPQWLLTKDEATSTQTGFSDQTLKTFTELSQAIAASLDLETTLQTILESIERLIPADRIETNLLEADHRQVRCYWLSGLPEINRKLEQHLKMQSDDLGYSSALISQRKPLNITNIESFQQWHPEADQANFLYKSYLGVPMEAAGNLVGTLELFSLDQGNFTETDVGVLKILSGHAALAIHNARTYEGEQRRARELAGLAQLAQAVSAQRLPENLYKHLVESIAPLLNAKIIGFLIYDENRRVLEGQVPFFGLHTGVLEWARFPIPPGSQGEQIWLEQKIIITSDAPKESKVQALGLNHLAIAAGIHQLILAPLTSSGKPLGYLLVGDKQDDTTFDERDLRILSIITGQASAILENASLVEQSHHRAQRAETLQRIAGLTASNASLDHILKTSLQDLAQLLHADQAAIFLLDEHRREVHLHQASLFGASLEVAARLGRLPMDDPQFRSTVTGSQRAYFSTNALEDARVLPVYRPIVQTLEVHSAIVVPLVSRGISLGELMLGSQKNDYFSQGDMQSVKTAAGQLAGAIERSHLSSQTDEKLRIRVDQLTAVNRISRELNSLLDLNLMVQRVYDEVVQATRADCGTIMLFHPNQNGKHTNGSGSPQIAIQLGEPAIDNLHPLDYAVIERAETVIVRDFEQTISLRDLRDPKAIPPVRPAHDRVRSAMVIPIAYQDNVAGLIHLHAKTANHFDDTSREIAETLSMQAAIALGNAYRYQEQASKTEMLNRRLNTMAKLLETNQALHSEQPLEEALNNIALAIQASTPFNTVLISVYNPENNYLMRTAEAGLQSADMETLRAHPQPWSKLQSILIPDFKIGKSYFIPHKKMPLLPAEVHTLTVPPLKNVASSGNGHNSTTWHPEDLLMVPLLNAQGEPLGLISVNAPRDNLRPDLATIESLEIFGSQVSLLIESQHKLEHLTQAHQQILKELDTSLRSSAEAQDHVRALKEREQEQSHTIQLLNLRSHQLNALLRVNQALIHQNTRSAALQAMSEAILENLEMDTVLIAESGEHGPRMVHNLGVNAEDPKLEALLGQRNPLTYCLQQTQNLLVPQRRGDTGWNNSLLLQVLQAEAFFCLPILSEGSANLALLASRTTPLPQHATENTDIYTLLADLVATKLTSLHATQETQLRLEEANLLLEFNQRLNSLEPSKILHTLLENAMQVAAEAQAGIVLLWHTNNNQLVPMAAQGYANPNPLLEATYHLEEEPYGQVFNSGVLLNLSEVDFATDYNLSGDNLLRYRKATAGKLPVSTLVTPIQLSAQNQVFGLLILENFQTSAAFPSETQRATTILCQQTALHLENTSLYQAAEERASQMQTLTEVATAITTQLEPDELIATLLDRLQYIVPYDTGTLWLLRGNDVIVQAARGFADEDQRIGLTAAIEDSHLLSEMISEGRPVYVRDIRLDQRFPSLLEPRYLSWAGIPLISGGNVIGVMALEKTEACFYTPEHIQLASTFAGQAAVALANAKLFQESQKRTVELNQRTNRLEMLNLFSKALSETLDPDHILMIALEELNKAIPCSSASAVLFNSSGTAQIAAEIPSGNFVAPVSLTDAPLFERLRQSRGIFITEDISRENELASLQDYLASRGTIALLVLPLTTGNNLHGALLLHNDRPYRFSSDEIELALTISNQAAIAIQNAQLYSQTRDLSAVLEQRVNERTAELAREHWRTETLLRILTELSSSLDLDQMLKRTLALVQEIVAAGQVMVLISRTGDQKLHRLISAGYTSSAGMVDNPTPCGNYEGLASWVLSRKEAVLIDDLLEDERWIESPDFPEPRYRSAIAVPILLGQEALGALMIYHDRVNYFSDDQLDLAQAAASQIAVAINNAELYRLIQEQADDLGVMVRNQQIEASRSRAILEAVADGVLVTDAKRKITLFNASAEKILGLESRELVGKSLGHFTGLFGRAAQSWMETIHLWSQSPASLESGHIHAEQIMLEDGQVVSVHLAPVTLGDAFLGTVSIFRDITHQVEIDRLKSEFVATVSHELRTPMTSIKGYVDLLIMGAADALSNQQAHFLDIIKENTDRLTILVNDLLDISRIESGRAALSMQPLNLLEIAGSVVEELHHRSNDDHKLMTIEIKSSQDLPMVLGDMERVRQILENLLENAYDYTPSSGHIQVHMHRVGEQIQVEIQDTGIGIHPDLHNMVFERFYRGEHPLVLETSGTGLGLSIVKHLVEMHQGKIWLKSAGLPGQGSTFYITLPVYTSNHGAK